MFLLCKDLRKTEQRVWSFFGPVLFSAHPFKHTFDMTRGPKSAKLGIRRKEKCLVPVTLPYLICWPDPKLFSFEYFWSDLLLNNQENFKERLKRSCKHSKNKSKLDHFNLNLWYVVLIEEKQILKIEIQY